MIKRCEICGKEFERKGPVKFCSDQCRKIAKDAWENSYKPIRAKKDKERKALDRINGILADSGIVRKTINRKYDVERTNFTALMERCSKAGFGASYGKYISYCQQKGLEP